MRERGLGMRERKGFEMRRRERLRMRKYVNLE